MDDVPDVLFVCTHNAGRSQLAAALLNQQARRAGPGQLGRLGAGQ
jgi:protein-tyrosine-phosphatase